MKRRGMGWTAAVAVTKGKLKRGDSEEDRENGDSAREKRHGSATGRNQTRTQLYVVNNVRERRYRKRGWKSRSLLLTAETLESTSP